MRFGYIGIFRAVLFYDQCDTARAGADPARQRGQRASAESARQRGRARIRQYVPELFGRKRPSVRPSGRSDGRTDVRCLGFWGPETTAGYLGRFRYIGSFRAILFLGTRNYSGLPCAF